MIAVGGLITGEGTISKNSNLVEGALDGLERRGILGTQRLSGQMLGQPYE
jgi:hypothetical protein